MLKLSRLTDYAVVVLVRLSRAAALDADKIETAPGIAAATGIPEPTVAKVLKGLAQAGLVVSQRGAHGGYRLNRSLAAIPVADVIVAIDGPIALTACVEGAASTCDSLSLCPMAGRWGVVNDAISEALSAITLADMQVSAIPKSLRFEPAIVSGALVASTAE